MRMFVMFDLPTTTASDKKAYTRFRKFLVTEGFVMMQYSIYTKIVLNGTSANLIKEKLRKNKPVHGVVQTLIITEKQFARMEYITGENKSTTIQSDERLIIL